MQNIIYIDMLFLINAIIGYFVLRATAWLCKCNSSVFRIILAAVLAGFSSFIIMFQSLPPWVSWVYKLCTCVFICAVAFNIATIRMLAKRVFWYMFLNISLAGVVFAAIYYFNAGGMQTNNLSVYFNVSPILLILCVVFVFVCVKLSGLFFGSPQEKQFYKISFKVLESLCTCNALVDTGFNVKDIFSGKKVIMLSLPLLEKQLPNQLYQDLMEYFKGNVPENKSMFFLISVQTANGIRALPAVKVKELHIHKKPLMVTHSDAAAVFTPERIGASEFEAIIGSEIMS